MNMECIKKWSLILGAIFAFLIIFTLLGLTFPDRVGDGSEYYALFLAWQETLKPWMSVVSFEAYDRLFSANQIGGLVSREWLVESFPALRLGGTADFNHFWFYSFLAFVISKFFSLVGLHLSPHSSFIALHFILVTFTSVVAFYFYKWQGLLAFLLMTITSPILWYLNKVHTELFTYCLTFSAIIFIYAKNYLPGAFLLALASTQNPSFGLIALFPFSYGLVSQRCQRFSFLEVCLVVGTVLAAIAHPTYYFLRFGVLTPQLLAGGASLGGNLSTFYIWIVDPDLGLLPNWPVGVIFIAVAICLYFYSNLNKDQSLSNFFYLFVIVFLLVNFYAHSSTTNLNSGATPGVARYSLWYLPLAFPLVLYVVKNFSVKNIYFYPFILILSLLSLFNLYKSNPVSGEDYSTPTMLSKYIQTNISFVYNPPHEVFAERYSGVGETIHSLNPRGVLGPDCRKLLIYPGAGRSLITTPNYCQTDQVKIRLLVDSLVLKAKKDEFYIRLSDGQLDSLKFVVSPGLNKVGTYGNGNYILGAGWSLPEEWGVWSERKRVKILLPCNSSQFYFKHEKIYLTLKLQPFGSQKIKVLQSGDSLLDYELNKLDEVAFSGLVNGCREKLISFDIEISNPKSPRELGQSSDARKLGVSLIEFTIK